MLVALLVLILVALLVLITYLARFGGFYTGWGLWGLI